MRFFKSIISTIALICFSEVAAQDEYVRGQDPQADAIRDMQTGMAGLQQAAKDPVLMAQLMQDLQVKKQFNPSYLSERERSNSFENVAVFLRSLENFFLLQ